MGFFQRLRGQQPPAQPIEGWIGYYNLGDWWLNTFTAAERADIEFMFTPLNSRTRPLTQGRFTSAPQSAADFLSNLCATYQFQSPSIAERIRAKIVALGGEPYPGRLNGRHYTDYINEVKQLGRDGDLAGEERLLLSLISTVETEARIRKWIVAPWYYEALAILYRKRKDYAAELAVIERYKHQPHGKDFPDDDVLRREAKARELLSRATDEK